MSQKVINLEKYGLSDIIYNYYDGSISKLTKENIRNNFNKGNIDSNQQSNLQKIRKLYEKYPNINVKLGKKPPDKSVVITKPSDVESQKKYISFQRKAFIDWINGEFYQNIIKQSNDSELNIWQIFVKNYLALDTPYRGLLVYHGLGTGKTSTAISTAEGLSESMSITTLLPASLETNFLNEIKRWGDTTFQINSNKWTLVTDITETFRKNLYDTYSITLDLIKSIHRRSVIKSGDNGLQLGYWIISDDHGKEVRNLEKSEQIYLNLQIEELIKLKYNFIHYNPFPKVKSTSLNEFIHTSESLDDEINLSDEAKTNNQKIVKHLEEKLKQNIETHNINSPFYNEVIIIDEVHNFVRQIINKSAPSMLFYKWILNSKNTKLICLSGTPIINKPSEIAVLFNMIRGLTRVYNFTIKLQEDLDEISLFEKLKDIFYKEHSPVHQIKVQRKLGKFIISFTQNTTKFESIMNPDNKIVYTVQYRNHDFKEFIDHIYSGLHKLVKDDEIIPSQSTINSTSTKQLRDIIRGKEVTYDTDVNIVFNRYRELFTIDKDIDLTNNATFMEYFFEGGLEIPEAKKTLLKRMMLGLVSYYPIDRSAIVNMPEVIIPEENNYMEYEISKKIKIETCEMSQLQFDKYKTAWMTERESKQIFDRINMYLPDDSKQSTYQIYTRRVCNMVYQNETFRLKKNDEYIVEKRKEYNSLRGTQLEYNKGLQNYSPKFNRIFKNMEPFRKDGVPTGKILFYSDFRQDAGSEAFELVLQSNGYSKYSESDTDKTKKLRYTFLTGSEKEKERLENKTAFNDEKNKYGEYIQILIISSAGAEGISLTSVRQVHILEPYWNYVRIEQVFGRANRIKSHEQLTPNKRNIEQFLYICTFPDGNNVDDVYQSMERLGTWTGLLGDSRSHIVDIEKDLFNHHKEIYDEIQKVLSVRAESIDTTIDEVLFNIMNKKYTISTKISDLIKEASVDCLQNTRDDYNIYQSCVQFDKKVNDENSYFPGTDANNLQLIDQKQLLAKHFVFLEPNIYIVSALRDNLNVYLYYKLNSIVKNPDIRYIQDYGKQIGIVDIERDIYLKIVNEHKLDSILGNRLSVTHEVYRLNKSIMDNINDWNTFPELSEIITDDNLIGFKIKFNVSDSLYFKFNDNKIITRLYEYSQVEDIGFEKPEISPIIVNDKKYYESV